MHLSLRTLRPYSKGRGGRDSWKFAASLLKFCLHPFGSGMKRGEIPRDSPPRFLSFVHSLHAATKMIRVLLGLELRVFGFKGHSEPCKACQYMHPECLRGLLLGQMAAGTWPHLLVTFELENLAWPRELSSFPLRVSAAGSNQGFKLAPWTQLWV